MLFANVLSPPPSISKPHTLGQKSRATTCPSLVPLPNNYLLSIRPKIRHPSILHLFDTLKWVPLTQNRNRSPLPPGCALPLPSVSSPDYTLLGDNWVVSYAVLNGEQLYSKQMPTVNYCSAFADESTRGHSPYVPSPPCPRSNQNPRLFYL